MDAGMVAGRLLVGDGLESGMRLNQVQTFIAKAV